MTPGAAARRFLLVVLALAVSGGCSSGTPAPTADPPDPSTPPGIELRYRWSPDRDVTFDSTETVQESYRMIAETGEGGGMDDQVLLADESTIETERSWGRLETVEVQRDGSARLRLVHDRFEVESVSPGGTVRWDSDTPTTDDADTASGATDEGAEQLAAERQPLVDHPVSFTATARGKVSDVDGTDAAFEALAGFLDPDIVDNAVQDYLDILPPGPVTVGETWSNQDEVVLPELGTLVGDDVYTLVGIETGPGGQTLALIDYRGDYRFEQASPEVLRESIGQELAELDMEVTLELTVQRAEGRVVFDVDAGTFYTTSGTMALLFNMVFTPNQEGDGPIPTLTVSAEIEASSETSYGTQGSGGG